jgi:transcriptional regulator with XRE-family HTH domain
MGRKERTKDYFRKRLKSERDRRGWSQADMAKMLSDKEIPMHPTTIAKIEAGDREVRIDEAAGIADLFGVSLDALLGRKGMEDDQSHALSVLAGEAEKVVPDLMQIRERVWRAYQDLAAQWDFQSFDEFVTDGATWDWSGLSLEHKRAMLTWTSRDIAMEQLTIVIAALADIVTIRSMTPLQLRKRIEMQDTHLAAIHAREHSHGGTSKGKR